MVKFLSKICVASLVLALLGSFGCQQEEAKKEAKPTTETGEGEFKVTSSAFKDGGEIPDKYANTDVSGGKNLSIPLSWENHPSGTKSIAISMIDKHPDADNFVHWLAINMSTVVTELEEGASSKQAGMPAGTRELTNSFNDPGYNGPSPPSGSGVHEYEITVYAIDDVTLDLYSDATLSDFESATKGKILGTAKITGKFSQ